MKNLTIAIIAWQIAAAVLWLIAISPAIAFERNEQRSYYDGSGSFAGSSSTRGNSTSFSDRDGRFSGSAIRNSDGTTSHYDRNGHFTGSSVNTTPRR